jgi:hypothetical protein
VETLAAPPRAGLAAPPPGSFGGAPIMRVDYAGKPLGLRYSILRNSSGDEYRETATDTVFYSGDRIRVAVEVNDAGYLYIAVKGASGTWKVLFPTAAIGDGSNSVESGRQYTIPPAPSRFAFDEQPGDEQIFIVLSRQPEPSLEQLLYSLRRRKASSASASAEPDESGPKVLKVQGSPLDESVIRRLRNEVSTRDLVLEKVDDSTPGEKEQAIYVLNRSGSVDSRLVADFVLKHQ